MAAINSTTINIQFNFYFEEKKELPSLRSCKNIWNQKMDVLKNPEHFKAKLAKEIEKISTMIRRDDRIGTSLCTTISEGKKCKYRMNCRFAHSLVRQVAANLFKNKYYKSKICDRSPCTFHPKDKCNMVHPGDVIHNLQDDSWTIYISSQNKQTVDRESSPINIPTQEEEKQLEECVNAQLVMQQHNEEQELIDECTNAYHGANPTNITPEPVRFTREAQNYIYASYELPAATQHTYQRAQEEQKNLEINLMLKEAVEYRLPISKI
ncbi:MAG: hypothetical protein COT85_05005 [Chlamydiae bacterium CG10_big_fil_rev_8_21_14_0_10_42_34]|nr:MAG: hypothetical protein COT85_05005 [Chlamydiae bacterium CG10_big_fil_rev_8_21_14_0_10_42_34]